MGLIEQISSGSPRTFPCAGEVTRNRFGLSRDATTPLFEMRQIAQVGAAGVVGEAGADVAGNRVRQFSAVNCTARHARCWVVISRSYRRLGRWTSNVLPRRQNGMHR